MQTHSMERTGCIALIAAHKVHLASFTDTKSRRKTSYIALSMTCKVYLVLLMGKIGDSPHLT